MTYPLSRADRKNIPREGGGQGRADGEEGDGFLKLLDARNLETALMHGSLDTALMHGSLDTALMQGSLEAALTSVPKRHRRS